jgi:hypothetical protein
MDLQVDLDSGRFCRQVITSRSKYDKIASRRCHKLADHSGKCHEAPFLYDLAKHHPRVAAKIWRDSIMTTGAAWKSEEAGPNRILRWVMLLPDQELLKFGIRMSALKPQVVAKLRDKAADYDSCIRVAMWLTYAAYQMPDAPTPPDELREYLEPNFGEMKPGSTTCVICLLPSPFVLFESAQRGKALIETCHKDPRVHAPSNVGFAHRECNIAQGAKTLDEFYDWIAGIVQRARPVKGG